MVIVAVCAVTLLFVEMYYGCVFKLLRYSFLTPDEWE